MYEIVTTPKEDSEMINKAIEELDNVVSLLENQKQYNYEYLYVKNKKDEFEQLVDGVPVIIKSNQIFRFKCCDCGLIHKMVIATKKNQDFGFVVERE